MDLRARVWEQGRWSTCRQLSITSPPASVLCFIFAFLARGSRSLLQTPWVSAQYTSALMLSPPSFNYIYLVQTKHLCPLLWGYPSHLIKSEEVGGFFHILQKEKVRVSLPKTQSQLDRQGMKARLSDAHPHYPTRFHCYCYAKVMMA